MIYRVHLSGSSIFGTLSGFDAYKRAQSLLQEKLDKGNLECFKWWCEECKAIPLAKASIVDRHVIKISIPNVLKIIAESKVGWKWEEPYSDWAKSKGEARDSFTDLVKRKSRPNWVIWISAEEAGNVSIIGNDGKPILYASLTLEGKLFFEFELYARDENEGDYEFNYTVETEEFTFIATMFGLNPQDPILTNVQKITDIGRGVELKQALDNKKIKNELWTWLEGGVL